MQEGLPTRITMGSVRDSYGLLWVSTGSGLVRYDGRRTYRPQVAQQFAGSLYRDHLGRLICPPESHPDSLEIFCPASLEAWGIDMRAGEGYFAGSFQRQGQARYFARGSQVYRLEEEPQAVFSLERPLRPGDRLLGADTSVALIYRAASGVIERSPGGGLISLDGVGEVLGGYLDRAGNCWVSTAAALLRIDSGGRKHVELRHPELEFPIDHFAEDEGGNLLLFSVPTDRYARQMLAYSPATGLVDRRDFIEVDRRIYSVSGTDFETDLRLNTYGGIYWLHFGERAESRFTKFLYRDLAPNTFGHLMRGFAVQEEGTVFATKDSYQPYYFRTDAEETFLDTIVIRDNYGDTARQSGCGMNAIAVGEYIFGTNCYRYRRDSVVGQVYRLDTRGDRWRSWDLPDLNHVPRSILPLPRQDQYLLVTEDPVNHREGALYQFSVRENRIAPVALDRTTGIAGYVKMAVFDEERRRYWIASTAGLYYYDLPTATLARYDAFEALSNTVSAILIDDDGSLLLGTLNHGLYRLDPETEAFTHIGYQLGEGHPPPAADYVFHNLPNDNVADLARTREGHLIVTTFDGLYVYSATDGTGYTFTTEHGLNHDEFNTESLTYNPVNDRYYAGGINGFVSFSVSDLLPRPSPHRIAFTERIQLKTSSDYELYQPLSGKSGTLEIGPDVIYTTIRFTLNDYLVGREATYQTLLEGYDSDWQPPTPEPGVRFTRLPTGSYTLHVRAADAFGNFTASPATLQLDVLPPWYRTPWAYLAYVLTFIAGLITIDRIRHRRLRQRLEQEQQYERHLAQLEMRTLRHQLNPHFISNAMNAIRHQVLTQDKSASADYIVDFARLMRLYLDSSRNHFITVADELDMLDRYVRLEQLRHPHTFTYEATHGDGIDPEYDRLPSLFLQPILENAIQHGLVPRQDRNGQLRLHIDLHPEDEDMLVCVVEDNGIGRTRAAVRTAGKPSGRQSHATNILAARTTLLSEANDVRIVSFTEDIDPAASWTGTRFTLVVYYGDRPLPSTPPRLIFAPCRPPVPGAT